VDVARAAGGETILEAMVGRAANGGMNRAECMRSVGDKPEYWAGFQRGLRHRYQGEESGTPEEHELWLSLTGDQDESRRQRGQAYRDGYNLGRA
jgi:hypothetical protein